jgi:hypothetical protein
LHHATAHREVLQRHGAFAFSSELDVLHVRIHSMIDSSDSTFAQFEGGGMNSQKGMKSGLVSDMK